MMQVRVIRLFQILALPFFVYNFAFWWFVICHVDLLCCKVFCNTSVSSVAKALRNCEMAVDIKNYYNTLRQDSNNKSNVAKMMSKAKPLNEKCIGDYSSMNTHFMGTSVNFLLHLSQQLAMQIFTDRHFLIKQYHISKSAVITQFGCR